MTLRSDARSTILFSKAKMKKNYLREAQQELKKVTWTTKEELVTLTKIVLGGTFLAAIAIYCIDITIRGVLETISIITRWIF